MARQPFFSGNYGSALAQVDTRPIMQGALRTADMYQGLGQTFTGEIEKYQLNKEKREKNEAAAIGTITGMPPEMLQALSANPETAKLIASIQGENASPKDFDKFNAMSAAYTVQQKSNLEQELQKTQNDMQGLAYGLQKKLQDTNVNMGINAGIVSDLLTKREVEQDPEKRKVYNARIREIIANFGMGASRRELETKQQGLTKKQITADESLIPLETAATTARLGDVPGQVASATAARKRADDTAKALLDAIGGAEGAAAMTVEEKNLSMNKIQSYINYMDRQGQASVLKALVGTAPPSVTKQAATLSAFQGDLLGYKVRDPINGGQISFEKYLELNNSEGEGDYPLTGDNAGTAGRINATFLNSQKQIDDLVKTVEVQAVVPGAVGGTSASGLPSAIDPSMTPAQADAAKTARITEIRTLIDNLNTEFANLGAPGQSMTTYPVAGGMGGSAPTTAPQTVGHISQREQQIPAKIAALRAELTQLANL